jgi:hypothetical protein
MSKMNLNFSDIGDSPEKPPASVAREIAKEAGAAEGFTQRVQPPTAVAEILASTRAKSPIVQLNLRLRQETRDAIQAAYEREAEHNRAIRSIGEFMELVFNEWQEGRTKT